MSGDNAIKSRDADRLGRAPFADHLATTLLSEPADEGLVAALVGAWGQGKSSVLNMVRERLEVQHSRTVLTFNPWMFSGQSQLVGAFFEQVAGQLQLRGKSEKALADRLLTYGQALQPLVFVPVAGAWLGRAGAVASALSKLRGASKQPDPVEQQKHQIEEALGKLDEPIFVFVDDIDRLPPQEIRDILGLVRLTAHFPNIIYLLAFDRAKVERALDHEDHSSGRNYLDKIVELSFDLPAPSPHALWRLLTLSIGESLSGVDTGPFDESRWQDIAVRVLTPLLSTPRDINRYVAALPAAVRMVGDEVALVDVLALEAVRLRLPDTFALLGPMTHALTSLGMVTHQTPGFQAEVEAFLRSGDHDSAVVAEVCRLLFPATERYLGTNTIYPSNWLTAWRRERRVASPEVLAFYLSKQLPPGMVPAATAQTAIQVMDRAALFQSVVDELTADELDDFVARLRGYVDEIAPTSVLPGCSVLLGLYPRLRTQAKGPFDVGPEWALDWVVGQMLRRIGDERERTSIVEELSRTSAGFTGRIRLLRLVGRRPNPDGERLVPVTESDRMYREVCGELRHASAAQVRAERNPLSLLAQALTEEPSDRDGIDQILQDGATAAVLLQSAVGNVQVSNQGSIAAENKEWLHWEILRTVVGDDEKIAAMLDRVTVTSASDPQAVALVELARKYLTGWRPAEPPFSDKDPVIRPATSQPDHIFPWPLRDGSPALLLRAVTTFDTDLGRASQADLSGSEFHHRLQGFLDQFSLVSQVTALAEARSLPTDTEGWKLDTDAQQFNRGAVQRLILGPSDHPAALLRYAVFLPRDQSAVMHLIADCAISPKPATDTQWGKLRIKELRDVLTAEVEAVSGIEAGQLVQTVYSGDAPPRATVELYVYSGQQTDERTTIALDKTIDLDTLGTPARPDMPPRQGMYAVSGDTLTTSEFDRRSLVVYALTRMALDWGYLDARTALQPLASSEAQRS